MKLGIMQPYFFPYIGYFSLIQYTDKFIFFDTPQYIHHGWVNRNRILKQGEGFKYITVPICKSSRETAIKNISIDNSADWKKSIYGGLSVYKKKAPYYEQVIGLIDEIFSNDWENLSELNISSIQRVCKYLEIQTAFDVYSKMSIDVSDEVKAPDEWALYITKELGYDTYVNPPGGETFFNREKYMSNGITLQFLEAKIVPYIQRTGRFDAALSIIDMMMFCDKEEIQDMLELYTIF